MLLMQVYPIEGPEQSGRQPGSIPSSHISVPTLKLSPQFGMHDDLDVRFPPEQIHFESLP